MNKTQYFRGYLFSMKHKWTKISMKHITLWVSLWKKITWTKQVDYITLITNILQTIRNYKKFLYKVGSKYTNTSFFNSYWAPSKIFRGLFAHVFWCKESKNFIYFKKRKNGQSIIMLRFFYNSFIWELVLSKSTRNNRDKAELKWCSV